MPIGFTIDAGRGRVLVEASGALTFADLAAVQATLQAHPDYRPEFDILSDLRGASTNELSADELRSLIARSALAPAKGARRAIVVSPGFDFGMARMFQGLAEANHQHAAIFTDLDEARRWLDVTPKSGAAIP